jgi:lysophospholipase L1-like esterase
MDRPVLGTGWTRRVVVGALASVLGIMAFAPSAAAATRTKVRKPGPPRVLLLGDSITAGYQDRAATALAALGYRVTKAGVGGRSLLDANMCRAGQAYIWADTVDPDIVVVQALGNYAQLVGGGMPACTPAVVPGTKPFFRRWRTAARLNQKVFTKRKARVLWILGPVTSPPKLVPPLNDIYRRVAGTKAEIVDAWSNFGGSTYNASLHIWDGVHLNETGSQRLANLVVTAIRRPA